MKYKIEDLSNIDMSWFKDLDLLINESIQLKNYRALVRIVTNAQAQLNLFNKTIEQLEDDGVITIY